jgi:hypothetical protein
MARTTNAPDRIRARAVELGVYLPLGAYSALRDQVTSLDAKSVRKTLDRLVDRGQDRVEPLERALRRRTRSVERRASDAAGDVRSSARKSVKKAGAAANAIAPKLPRVAAPKNASELAIPSYNSLTAGEITTSLKGLTQTELAKVYKYESAHESRATVMDAISGKLVELPIPTYDALTVDEITSRLDGLSQSDLKTIRRYESDTKQRQTILDKLETLI